MKKLGAMFTVNKWDVVGGWFGFGTVTDLPENDNLAVIRQGPGYRVVLLDDITQNFTAEQDITR